MFEMVLGHFIGDYLLQPKDMAMMKTKNTFYGWMMCILHCFLYTVCVCLMMQIFTPIWVAIVFFSHFFIDKFSLGEHWLRIIGGRSLKSTVEEYSDQSVDEVVRVYGVSFSSLVYTIVDNTWHILLMYVGYKLLFGV